MIFQSRRLTSLSFPGTFPYWHCQWPYLKVILKISAWHTTGASFLIAQRVMVSNDERGNWGHSDQTPHFLKKGGGVFYFCQDCFGFNFKTMHFAAVEGGRGLRGEEPGNHSSVLLVCGEDVLCRWWEGRAPSEGTRQGSVPGPSTSSQ